VINAFTTSSPHQNLSGNQLLAPQSSPSKVDPEIFEDEGLHNTSSEMTTMEAEQEMKDE
jgi:hypothetical protein